MSIDPELIKIIAQIIGQAAVTALVQLGRIGLKAWQERRRKHPRSSRRRSRRRAT